MSEEEILVTLSYLQSEYEKRDLTKEELKEFNNCLKQMFYITADLIGPSDQYKNYVEEHQ